MRWPCHTEAAIAPQLIGHDAGAQAADLPLYRYLGGPNATRLPVPNMNVLNGGVHAHWQGADFQEFMIAPYGASSFREALEWGSDIYHALRTVLMDNGHRVGVGDEGGFAPEVASNEEPLELIVRAIDKAGLRAGPDVSVVYREDPIVSIRVWSLRASRMSACHRRGS
jgi:enolase